jgi:hypoxanthine phosphoribosyltransferase
MKVFLSWSGDKSHRTARAIREWLPLALDHIEPFVSDLDIGIGDQWRVTLEKNLREGAFGIVCLTRDNLNAEWLGFEVGWLSAQEKKVAILLVDLEISEVPEIMKPFQLASLRGHDIELMVRSINGICPERISDAVLKQRFKAIWPILEERLGTLSMGWDDYEDSINKLTDMIWRPPDRNDFEPDIIVCVNHGGTVLGGLIYYKKGRAGSQMTLTTVTKSSEENTVELNQLIPKALKRIAESGRKLRILLVDDSLKSGSSMKSVCEMVRRIAAKHGEAEIKTAVIVNREDSSHKALQPDYFLKEYGSVIRFPYGPI